VAIKTCTVVVHDLNETEHSLDVTAETLYEAIAQALAAFRGQDWVGEIGKGLTTVTVKVRASRADACRQNSGFRKLAEERLQEPEGHGAEGVAEYDFVQFLVLLSGGIAPDDEDTFHLGIEQTFAENALSDHSRCPKKNHLHV